MNNSHDSSPNDAHYYKVLGLPPSADTPTLKRAYKRLALQYHPDVCHHLNAEPYFKEINHAYRVLRARQQPPSSHRPQGPSASPDNRHERFVKTLTTTQAARVRCLQASLAITLEEVCLGVNRLVTINLAGIHHPQYQQTRQLRLNLPAGLREGQLLHIGGKGQHDEIELNIIYQPHSVFHCEGQHLFIKLPLSHHQARHGGQLTVPTLSGTTRCVIPAGSTSGSRILLAGHGLPGSGHGDLYVTLYVEADSTRSHDACELYRQTAQPRRFGTKVATA